MYNQCHSHATETAVGLSPVACSRVLMLYRIHNGLVAIPASIYLQPTVVHTRGFETSYRQIQCNTSMCSQTFFPSAIRLCNTLPVDVCQLPPDSFKAQLNTIQLMQLPTDHIFNCTTALFLSAAVQLPVGHHYCSYYFLSLIHI